ncbi:signal recognition particle-docking protein FtsY [Candidatus Woesearchaeota archaeon]|nr:signal recognition particle-docking protein FtsY [Candidatus Woesearchaeota archaeon]
MFGKLKEKLKSALSIFSRKAEEEAQEKVILPEKPLEEKKESPPQKVIEKKKEKVKEIHNVKPEVPPKQALLEKKEKQKPAEKPITTEKVIPTIKSESPPPSEKKSFFGKLKEAITTRTISAEKFNDLFWELEVALLENNVSVAVIEKIKDDLKQELVEKPLPRDVETKIRETLHRTLQEIVSFEKIDFMQTISSKKPFIIAFFGINGSGKTTSIAKLAYYLQQKKMSIVLAACDTFRAAAIQQLEEHADKLGVKMIKHEYGSDAAAVAFDAVKYAEKNKIDVVLIDTAGRLHSNTNLMAELEKIIRVTKPHLKIFVGESITGNDCIEQARQFNELVDLDGCILTKADVDEKGGAPLSIAYTIKKPILFLGVGQKYGDLQEFQPELVLKQLGL